MNNQLIDAQIAKHAKTMWEIRQMSWAIEKNGVHHSMWILEKGIHDSVILQEIDPDLVLEEGL